ncbi:MAG: hypothetical protein JSR86_15260 [Proteobacteria bacterium]|nr:hypothetical protein [Pseudomonadota bacterium]
MNLKTFSLAAAAMIASAGPVMAGPSEDAFDAFRTVCGATAGEYPAVIAAADGAGWQNTQIVTDTMKGVSITDKQARHKPVNGETLALFATRGVAGKPGDTINVSTCTISSKADFATLVSLTQKWLGMPAHDTTATKVGFRYTPAGAGAAAVADNATSAAAAGAGYMMMSVNSVGGGQVTLDLVKLKK